MTNPKISSESTFPAFTRKEGIKIHWLKWKHYRPVHKKYDSSKLKIFINEKFQKNIQFFTCILPNNVAHDITKEFWKNSHFENARADSKFTSVRNMLDLPLKYWFMKAKVVFWMCYGPQK